jgi:hypothetical protein
MQVSTAAFDGIAHGPNTVVMCVYARNILSCYQRRSMHSTQAPAIHQWADVMLHTKAAVYRGGVCQLLAQMDLEGSTQPLPNITMVCTCPK